MGMYNMYKCKLTINKPQEYLTYSVLEATFLILIIGGICFNLCSVYYIYY